MASTTTSERSVHTTIAASNTMEEIVLEGEYDIVEVYNHDAAKLIYFRINDEDIAAVGEAGSYVAGPGQRVTVRLGPKRFDLQIRCRLTVICDTLTTAYSVTGF
jgi:hypothetical protein